jgi:hypothetical protein
MNESLQEQVKKTYNLIVQANNQSFEIWRLFRGRFRIMVLHI